MLLFLSIAFAIFVAEMGDKTQLLMIAMMSRFKVREIIIGIALSNLALNALAVSVGALISQFIPAWLIKIIAALAFFYFAWSTLHKAADEDTGKVEQDVKFPVLTIFTTFFLAELGDKTQLTAIAFAADVGLKHVISVWAACSIGLFAADLIGMLVGYLLKNRAPARLMQTIAFVVFAAFGFLTMQEGSELLLGGGMTPWLIASGTVMIFVAACIITWRSHHRPALEMRL